ncbi:MAG: hypothetical protein KME05_20135, partial [Gloeocapsa sp. UFS-A4-WI-NPMV-4B04]|nr:hypothetical protein [Gloeocapsa sp. UFS-A4-WI-NPMV-4B04]
IEFDCFDHFAAQVIVVGFGHWAKSTVGQSSYDIVLTYLALAIVEKLQEGINHFSDKKPEMYLTKTPIKQAKKDTLVKITE